MACEEQVFIARYLEMHHTQAEHARGELDRLRGLIDDAYERLMSSFGAIGALTERSLDKQADADEVREDMDHAVGNAISALQFQDMANQLVGHAAKRIASLERLTDTLRRLPDASVDELAQAVADAGCERNFGPVEQESMASGSTELF